MSTEQPAMLYCERCNKVVPLLECAILDPEVGAGLPTDQTPDRIHVLKHRRCKWRIFLPGRAPLQRS